MKEKRTEEKSSNFIQMWFKTRNKFIRMGDKTKKIRDKRTDQASNKNTITFLIQSQNAKTLSRTCRNHIEYLARTLNCYTIRL